MQQLDAYFRRVGLTARDCRGLDGLRAVVLAHATRIPFENIDAWVGRAVDLDPAAVARKLLTQRRGGWCFEHNLLLGQVLRALGFEVTDLAARVLYNRPPGAVPPRTHRLLRVEVDGAPRIADVGFGGLTLTGVLDLQAGRVQGTPHGAFRLVEARGGWVLEADVRGTWSPLYWFDLHPHLPVDFEAANFQLAHDPASLFRQVLMAARATDEVRLVLRDLDFSLHRMDGSTGRRRLSGPEELLRVLDREFGIDAAGVPGFLERAARLADAPAAPGVG